MDNWRQRHFDSTRLWRSQQEFDDHKERLREKFTTFVDPKPLSLDKLRAIAAIIDSP